MKVRIGLVRSLLAASLIPLLWSAPAPACCPAGSSGRPVVNADQTVIILWDAANKMQHFIRQASFKSEGDNFAFLVPSPTQPELNESGDEAFKLLRKLTEPAIVKARAPSNIGCGCSKSVPDAAVKSADVRVLEEKTVAGFDAVVLEADSANALSTWLKENGYELSPAVEAWAKPYVEQGWKITALKVAKAKDQEQRKDVTANALRLSFKTDQPLFPYREPDYGQSADALGARSRLLRIYFLGDAKYQGDLTKVQPWTGRVAWAGKVSEADRTSTLQKLKLPETTASGEWWLTEFEDRWPYKVAPADLYFAKATDQSPITREPITQYISSLWPTDVTAYALIAVVFMLPLRRRFRADSP